MRADIKNTLFFSVRCVCSWTTLPLWSSLSPGLYQHIVLFGLLPVQTELHWKVGRLFRGGGEEGGGLRGCVGMPRTRATFFSWTRKLWLILGLPVSVRRSWFPDSERHRSALHGRPETPGNQYLLSLFFLSFFFPLCPSFFLWQQLRDTEWGVASSAASTDSSSQASQFTSLFCLFVFSLSVEYSSVFFLCSSFISLSLFKDGVREQNVHLLYRPCAFAAVLIPLHPGIFLVRWSQLGAIDNGVQVIE